MAQTSHTPGPWHLDPEKTQRHQAMTGGIAIKAYSSRYDQDVALYCIRPNETFGGVETALADVRLISTAPEMKAALSDFIAQWEACGPNSQFGRYFSNVYQAAKAAMARAEGSTNA